MYEVFSQNRTKNSIDSLLKDGTISTNWLEINEHIVQFYKKLYTKLFSWNVFLLILLMRMRQVLEVVKAMNGDKAPSPNGYSMVFLQACWVALKEDIIFFYK